MGVFLGYLHAVLLLVNVSACEQRDLVAVLVDDLEESIGVAVVPELFHIAGRG